MIWVICPVILRQEAGALFNRLGKGFPDKYWCTGPQKCVDLIFSLDGCHVSANKDLFVVRECHCVIPW